MNQNPANSSVKNGNRDHLGISFLDTFFCSFTHFPEVGRGSVVPEDGGPDDETEQSTEILGEMGLDESEDS